ncbi:MAG: sce7726 family protein [Butyrivibrio sp.]|nr:sce7726 family protein [Butyrivibrio sp.]
MYMNSLSFSEIQQLSKSYSPLKSESDLLDLLYSINSNAYYDLNKSSARTFITSILFKYYPNEASVKSAFINKRLVKSSAISLFEFPVGNSRIDLCKINGTSHAYEIKTDLDNLNRLDKQLNDYKKVFEYIHIICSEKKLSEIIEKTDSTIGITYYSHKNGDYHFYNYRNPQKSVALSSKIQLQALSSAEMSQIKLDNNLSKDSSIDDVIEALSNSQINKEFKKALKTRYQDQWFFLNKYMNDIPNIDYQFFFKNCIAPCKVYQ